MTHRLGKLIFDVGVLLARVCDNFGEIFGPNFCLLFWCWPCSVTPTLANPEGTLSSLIAKSKSSKARLLHYYPEDPNNLPIDDNMFNDALCGTHLDHSLLTGLCKLSTTSLSTWNYHQSLMPWDRLCDVSRHFWSTSDCTKPIGYNRLVDLPSWEL